MAKSKGKDIKKAAKPAKTKSKPVAKKAAKPVAKKVAPKPKKAVKPVAKKAKPVAKPVAKKAVKAVKAKPVAKKKPVAKPVAKVVNKVAAPKAKPVVKKAMPVAKPIKQEKPVVVAAVKPAKPIKPTKQRKDDVKRIFKDDVKPFVKQLYKPQVTPAPDLKPAKRATMKEDLNLRYSDKELKEFKDLIDGKLASAREELKNLKEALDNHTESQAGNKAWNMEEGTDTSEMEYLMNQISRQHQYIRNLELALVRIENKTYGICRVSGKLIPKERLRIVPHATLSLEAKNNRKSDDTSGDAVVTAAPPTDFAEGFED